MKEKLYRLEVQNRVFKREAVTLKAEILRLERELVQNISLRDSVKSLPATTGEVCIGNKLNLFNFIA